LLKSDYYQAPNPLDQLIFDKLVPADHLLRQVKQWIDFEAFRDLVRDRYSADLGRTAEDPVRLIQLEYLQFQYNLSDREVLRQVQVNVAFRFFLDLSLDSPLPTSGLLSQFRTRLGEARHRQVFEALIAQARQHGLVKDRLRLKDATHVLANIAIPSGIQLVAQTRTRLLQSAQPYDAQRVAQEEAQVQQIRTWSQDLPDEERLLARVEHLRRIVAWADNLQIRLGPPKTDDRPRQHLDQALALAHRILEQGDHPDQGDQVRSVEDVDARRGKHGSFYDGYQLDLTLDADSELITQVDTPPANQDEAANASRLIIREEQAQGNRVEAISMDGVGFRGEILRHLQAPQGLGLAVYVPPVPQGHSPELFFPATAFRLEEAGRCLVCPAGQATRSRSRSTQVPGWQFYFTLGQCRPCEKLKQCMTKLPQKHGRTVVKNDYEAEYQAARQVAQTAAYAQVRQEHPKVERKFAEVIRFHGGRRTRYRGRGRVLIQYLLIAMVVNIKRMVKLLGAAQTSSSAQMAMG
jgi:transposase